MTKEEAIARIKEHKIIHKMDEPRAIYISEALDMAIKALEQEPTYYPPCIDCNKKMDEIRRAYDKLKPQESKTGHWIKIEPYPLQMHDYECSGCGHETDDNTENYCSECGRRMVEPQESEDNG